MPHIWRPAAAGRRSELLLRDAARSQIKQCAFWKWVARKYTQEYKCSFWSDEGVLIVASKLLLCLLGSEGRRVV